MVVPILQLLLLWLIKALWQAPVTVVHIVLAQAVVLLLVAHQPEQV